MYSAIVLCGGKNSRLKNFKKKIVKPLILYKKKTLLEHHLNMLELIKINDIFINTYKNEKLFKTLKKRKKLNFKIINENFLKGTAGVVFSNYDKFQDNILVLYGDNFLKIDIKRFHKYFIKNNLDFLIGVYKKKDFSVSGFVKFDKNKRVKKFIEKSSILKNKVGYSNAGIYLFKKKFFKKIGGNKFLDFANDIFSKNIFNHKCQIYKIKSCLTFDTIDLLQKNLKN